MHAYVCCARAHAAEVLDGRNNGPNTTTETLVHTHVAAYQISIV